MSTTAYLSFATRAEDASLEAVATALEATTTAETDETKPASPIKGDRQSNFVLESVASASEATTKAAAFVGKATLRAIFATGDAAEMVIGVSVFCTAH